MLTCSALAPGLVLLLYRESLVRPGDGEVHRDLQRLLAVRHLADLPHGEGEVEVHRGALVVIEQYGRLLLVVGGWEAPGQFLGCISGARFPYFNKEKIG